MAWWKSEIHNWITLAVAGTGGGIVRWIALKEGWRDGAGSLICGCITAVMAGPVLQPVWTIGGLVGRAGLSDIQQQMFSGFCTGVAGILITGFIIDTFKARTTALTKGSDDDDDGKCN
jgi:hypothetical protein